MRNLSVKNTSIQPPLKAVSKVHPRVSSRTYSQLISRNLRSSMGSKIYEKTANLFGKGRFGKRALSFTVDYGGGHSLSHDSCSNDSGIEYNSCESQSQLSWYSEDAHFGRSLSSSSQSNICIPQFPSSRGKEQLCEDFIREKTTFGQVPETKPNITRIFDINAAKLLMPEKAQLVSSNMRMSPDTTDSNVQSVHQDVPRKQMMNSIGSEQSQNATSPTSTVSPIPMKRARFSYPSQNLNSPLKSTGLKLRNQNQNGRGSIGKRLAPGTAPTLTSVLSPISRDGRVQLQIVAQPEEQHRARYQTEGSRGAIKDRKGNGFPTVRLVGYDKPATLQIFIGSDQGKVSPHMFYQACKVTGKSSTPCIEKKIEGTIVIEIEFEPSKEMVISCDCVGILKERNVDVEQRFPFHHASQSRKKSTKCRMIFRTTIINSQGIEETLQLSSVQILCTQPPGLPEICKQSIYECPAKGGLELFVIGKNFLKDTKVVFEEEDREGNVLWESTSEPLKDYLQQNHLICGIPSYKEQNIINPIECKVTIISGGKQSEPHRFMYLPNTPAADFGIPANSACVPKSPINQQVSTIQQDGLAQSLSHGQQLLVMDLQTVGSLSSSSEPNSVGSSVNASNDVASPTMLSEITCQQSQLGASGSPVTTLPQTLSFSNNILTPTTSAQERQVVNELQSMLEQTVQQNQQHEKAVAEMMSATNIMAMKPETTYNSMDMSQTSLSTSVPLDLQFPTDTVTVQTVQTIMNPVQVSGNYQDQSISNPSFVSSSSVMNCINPDGSLLNRTEMNMGQQMLAELLPNSQAAVDVNNSLLIPTTSTTNSMAINNNTVGMNSNIAETVTTNGMTIANLIKPEPSTTLASNVSLTMSNGVVLSNQPTTVNGTINQANYMATGELQPHHGSLANALTQLSESDLLNYINPSCFEQNLM